MLPRRNYCVNVDFVDLDRLQLFRGWKCRCVLMSLWMGCDLFGRNYMNASLVYLSGSLVSSSAYLATKYESGNESLHSHCENCGAVLLAFRMCIRFPAVEGKVVGCCCFYFAKVSIYLPCLRRRLLIVAKSRDRLLTHHHSALPAYQKSSCITNGCQT